MLIIPSRKRNLKIFIVGHGRHGKDEAAIMLKEQFNLSFTSSSWFCAERFIFDIMKNEHGYKDVEECFNDRHNKRMLWEGYIHDYNDPYLWRLSEEIFRDNDIYVGIRNGFEHASACARELADFTLHVDAFGRVNYVDPSYSIFEEFVDVRVKNNGTLADFADNMEDVYEVVDILDHALCF